MEIQVGMLVCSRGLSRGWNNVTDEDSVLESRTEQWLFSWMDWEFRLSLGKVVELHSHAKQAVVWNRATVVCILWLVEINWSVDGQRGFMYYVSSDYRLAANGHTFWMHMIVFMMWNCKERACQMKDIFITKKLVRSDGCDSIVLLAVVLSRSATCLNGGLWLVQTVKSKKSKPILQFWFIWALLTYQRLMIIFKAISTSVL
jgi:hypothetical protein